MSCNTLFWFHFFNQLRRHMNFLMMLY
uniref:Uncharacterized protein n=1 Tax=Arundo donax TaxID=35708 RepID=A0A0A9BDS1_ARUDO